MRNTILPIELKFENRSCQSKERFYGIYGGSGWIRTAEAEATDLQSAPFDRSGTLPLYF